MSIISDLIERARAVVFRGRDERELREELRFHVEMEADQNRRAGMSDGEARRRSILALGGVERTKEEIRDARGTRFANDTARDVSYALRTLRRSPGFAIVAILTLAVGIGGTTAVYSAVDAVLLQPLPYQQPGQLVRLYQYWIPDAGTRAFVTPVHFLDYRDRTSSFESAAAILTYDESGADIGTGDAARRIRLLPVSADYFDVLRARPAIGRPFDRSDEVGQAEPVVDISPGTHKVILSRALWEQRFHGEPGALGQTMVMGGESYTVTGVMPAGFSDPIAGTIDAWIPMDLRPGKDPGNANNHYLTVIARLRSGVSIARAQAELDLLHGELTKQYPNTDRMRARLYPLKEDIVGSSTRSLEIMMGAVALVLVLVCVNIANLLLVRGSERAREFALRSALGAERARLVRQMLIESVTLALAGDIGGLIIARLAMPVMAALGGSSIPRLATLHLEPRLLAVSVGLATLCAIGFGLAPALRAARTQPGDALREQGRSSTGGGAQMRGREWLVVSQVALAFVLLAGAGLLIASMQRIRNMDLGIQASHALVFEVHLPDARYDSTGRRQFYDALATRIEEIPGVRAAGGISKLPATGAYNQWYATVLTGPLAADEKRRDGVVEERIVSGDYFKAAGIPLIDGRLFNSGDNATAPDRVLVSQNFARSYFPGVRAVGQRVHTGDRNSEVIGVVGDVALDAEGQQDVYIYHPHDQWSGERNWSLTQVVRADGSLAAAQTAVRGTLAAMDPQMVMFRPMPLADAVGQGEAQRIFTLRLLTAFALVALALAALGLFGVLSYGVRLRTREFGIRMALGAEAGAIRRMVLRQGLTMTAIGTVVGLLGAVALSRVMASVVFHGSALDPPVLGAAALFMAAVSAVAAYIPARRATSVDPRDALQ